MIFARRSIQTFINSLEPILGSEALDKLVARLNKEDMTSLDTEWEIALLYAFSKRGLIEYEKKYESASPDLTFKLEDRPGTFIADFAAVSDRGLHDQYPIDYLMEKVRGRQRALDMPGTISFEVGGAVLDRGPGKRRVELGLPARKDVQSYVATKITPWLRGIKEQGAVEARKTFSTEKVFGFTLIYRLDAHVSHGSRLSFEAAYSRTNNPIFNALKRKADQLRATGFEGCKGIFLCDAGCSLLRHRQVGVGAYSDKQVIDAFLRNHEISFVVTLFVERQGQSGPLRLHVKLFLNPTSKFPLSQELIVAVNDIPSMLPFPVNDGVNSIHRIEEGGYGRRLRSHGGHEMSRDHFRMSARALLEILSGQRAISDFDKAHDFDPQNGNPFKRCLNAGRLIKGISVEHQTGLDDDWIRFDFASEPDAAVAPFSVPNKAEK